MEPAEPETFKEMVPPTTSKGDGVVDASAKNERELLLVNATFKKMCRRFQMTHDYAYRIHNHNGKRIKLQMYDHRAVPIPSTLRLGDKREEQLDKSFEERVVPDIKHYETHYIPAAASSFLESFSCVLHGVDSSITDRDFLHYASNYEAALHHGHVTTYRLQGGNLNLQYLRDYDAYYKYKVGRQHTVAVMRDFCHIDRDRRLSWDKENIPYILQCELHATAVFFVSMMNDIKQDPYTLDWSYKPNFPDGRITLTIFSSCMENIRIVQCTFIPRKPQIPIQISLRATYKIYDTKAREPYVENMKEVLRWMINPQDPVTTVDKPEKAL